MNYVAASLVLLIASLSANAAPRRVPTIVDRIRDMKPVVVQIGFTSDAPQANPVPRQVQRAGTGFFVSKQAYVLTAGHVIQGLQADAKANGASKVVVKVGLLLDLLPTPVVRFRGSFEWMDSIIVDIDDLHDLALLKLSRNPFTGEMTSGVQVKEKIIPLTVRVARLDAALPPEGDDILISGFPLEIPTFVTQKGMVASESFSLRRTQMQGAPAGFLTTEAEDLILVDAVVNPGNSGGPVYSSRAGDVVGVCEAYENSPLFTNKGKQVQIGPEEFLKQNAGLAVVIPIEYGIKLLMKNGVSDFLTTRTHSPHMVH